MRFECVSRTHVGLRRKINEDSVLVDAELGLFAVADGMGGHDAGEVASTMVTDALRCIEPAGTADELAAKAVESLRSVNGQLIDLARAGSKQHDSTIGTTVVGLAIAGERFSCFWMGDSRAYRIRHGKIARMTHDHSVVQNLVDAGLLKAEDAETHQNANIITRAIGAAEKFDIELVRGDVKSGDQFLLASDGLTRLVPDDELESELNERSLDKSADALVDLVMARGAPDNVSLVIVRAV
jgi:serine/threonine protein phosphatase PrpC